MGFDSELSYNDLLGGQCLPSSKTIRLQLTENTFDMSE